MSVPLPYCAPPMRSANSCWKYGSLIRAVLRRASWRGNLLGARLMRGGVARAGCRVRVPAHGPRASPRRASPPTALWKSPAPSPGTRPTPRRRYRGVRAALPCARCVVAVSRIVMTATEFEAAGLYDPSAENAGERLELLDWLVGQGASLEQLVTAHRAGLLMGVASDLVLRPGARMTVRQVAEQYGLDVEYIRTLSLALGLPPRSDDDAIYTDEDARMIAA